MPRVRGARTRTTSHSHSEFREQGHDGQFHSQGQHRINCFIRRARPPECLNNGFISETRTESRRRQDRSDSS